MRKPETSEEWGKYILENFGIKAEVYETADPVWYARFDLLESMFKVAQVMERWGYRMNMTVGTKSHKKVYKLMVFTNEV